MNCIPFCRWFYFFLVSFFLSFLTDAISYITIVYTELQASYCGKHVTHLCLYIKLSSTQSRLYLLIFYIILAKSTFILSSVRYFSLYSPKLLSLTIIQYYTIRAKQKIIFSWDGSINLKLHVSKSLSCSDDVGSILLILHNEDTILRMTLALQIT